MKTSPTELELDTQLLRKGKMILRAINHSLRLKMLQLIHKNSKMKVQDIYAQLKIEQPVASQHLAILRRAHIVVAKRDARNIFYSIDYARVKEIQELSKKLVADL